MSEPTTEAQRRALEWLPGDGSWKTNPGAILLDLVAAVHGRSPWIEARHFPYRQGLLTRWRLTAAGMTMRQEISGK